MSDLITAAELADRLRVKARTIQEWTREGRIPAVRINSKIIRYDPHAVLRALEQQGASQ